MDHWPRRQPATLDQRGRAVLEIDALARKDGFHFFLVRGPTSLQRVFELTATDEHLVFLDAPEESTRRTVKLQSGLRRQRLG